MRWSPMLLVVMVAIVLAAGCSSPSANLVEPPPVVVEEWLGSIDDRDFDGATDRTFGPAMAIVIAVENDLSTAETAEFLANGIPASVTTAYWASFQAGFDAFAGYPLSKLGVGASEAIFTEGVQFSAVQVTDPGDGDGDGMIFTRDETVRQIDLVATLAPGFVDPLLVAYQSLPNGADGDLVRSAYEETVVPAMWAAISSGQYDDAFTRKALALIEKVTTTTLPSP